MSSILIIGAGGHAKSSIDVIEQTGKYKIYGVINNDPEIKSILDLKIIGNEEKKQKAMEIADKYRTNIIDISEDSIVFELIGTSKIVDEIIEKFSEIEIHSMSRTGVVAGFRGNKTIMTN